MNQKQSLALQKIWNTKYLPRNTRQIFFRKNDMLLQKSSILSLREKHAEEKKMVTVIVYANNAEKNLKKCVYSVLNQTYDDFEIIIIDDASRDNTSDVALKLEEEDDRVRMVGMLKKTGSASAKNTGIYQASGNYIMFLNSDDELEPNALEIMTKAAKKNAADLVIGNFKYKIEKDEERPAFSSGSMQNDVFCGDDVIKCIHFQCIEGSKLWSAEMISHSGVKFQNICISSDFVFYHQCLCHCNTVVTMSDQVLMKHIYNNSNSKKYNDTKNIKTPFELIKESYEKAGKNNFAAEVQKDELKYCIEELKKIPEYETKEIRENVFDSLTGIDFDHSVFVTEEEKVMIKKYEKIKKRRYWYVSDIFAKYRMMRR